MLSEKSIFVFIGWQKERAMFSVDEMPWALDKGSQPYSCPLGDCEMAGESDTPILYLAFR